MAKFKFFPPRAPGNYDPNEASREAGLACPEPTLTQQHQADETDINLIVKRYMQTGVLPQSRLEPLYGDFETFNFHDAQNRIRAAEEAFMAIPAEIRQRFNNDPATFVEFAANPENESELIRLKLRDPRPEDPVTPPVPSPAPTGGSADPPPQG